MKWPDTAIVFFFILLTGLVVGGNLNKPFWGVHDWNGARYGTIARNYLNLGLVSTRLAQWENGEVNTHYPPLFPLLIAASYRLFGVSAWTTRMVPLIATACAVVLLYLIGTQVWSRPVGVTSALLALATVVVRYFGKMPVHEPVTLAFALLAVWCVLTGRIRWGILATLACLLTNWLGVYLVLGITVLMGKKAWQFWLLAGCVLGWHLLHTWWITGSIWGGGLWEIFVYRTGRVDVGQLIQRWREWSISLYSVWLLAAFGLGSLGIWWQGDAQSRRLWLALFIYGFGYAVTFANAAYIHDYFIYGSVAVVSLSAAVLVAQTAKWWPIWAAMLWLAVWQSTNPYVMALEASQGDRLAVEIGKFVQARTAADAQILVTPLTFAASRRPQLAFYADRIIQIDPAKEYNWILEIDEEDQTYELVRSSHRP